MKVLEIHNFHRKGSVSGDDQVFKREIALVEFYGNAVIKYTISNDEFDNAGIVGKIMSTLGMLWSFKYYRAVEQLIKKNSRMLFMFIRFSFIIPFKSLCC